MAKFGWAYVDCDDTADTIGATCPTGSVLFSTGTRGATGSINFMYYTASTYSYSPNTVVLSGNLIVTGSLTASTYHIANITTIDATGSTYFGDSNDDSHVRTGSLIVTASNADFVLSASVSDGRTWVRGFGGNYVAIGASQNPYTVKKDDFLIGITDGNEVTIYLPSASVLGAGSLMIIKDQVIGRGPNSIWVSGSHPAGGFTIEGAAYYQMTGSNPAINIYSNGTNWFVF